MLDEVQIMSGSDGSDSLSSLRQLVVQHVHCLVDEDEGVDDSLSVCGTFRKLFVRNRQEIRGGVLRRKVSL